MTGHTINTFGNIPDPTQVVNPNQSFIAGTIDDTGGIQTNAQLNALFPSISGYHQVNGTNHIYQYNGSTWYYFTVTNCS